MMRANLGCGGHVRNGWVNIDVVKTGPDVIVHDLSKGVPLPDVSCKVVYHSHVLEHLRKPDARLFMRECYRVLQPGGVLRTVVPDLERMCRAYLRALDGAIAKEPRAAHDYEWILLELYDQAVREESGGGMRSYLQQDPLPNEEFVYQRIGDEGRQLVASLRALSSAQARGTGKRMFRGGLAGIFSTMRNRLGARMAQMWICLAGGQRAVEAHRIGRFRLGGEVHQWMYDRYSLAQLMMAAGFLEPREESAMSSSIPDWELETLDILPDGTVRKPDSLFMEARKPE